MSNARSPRRPLFRLAATALLSLAPAPAFAAATDSQDILMSAPDDQVIARHLSDREDSRGASVIELVERGRTIWGSRSAYLPGTVTVLWRRQRPDAGPDLIVGGYTGGSHCSYDVIAIDLDADQPVQVLSMCNHDLPQVTTDDAGQPRFGLFFDIEGFNAASAIVAGVEIPMRWDGDQFIADPERLLTPPPDRARMDRIDQTIRRELAAWSFDDYRADIGFDATAPETNQALLGLILEGHAVEARALLFRAWPDRIAGRDRYWDDFCGAVVHHRLWRQLGLAAIVPVDRLP